MALYAANGSMRVTIVDGATRTGLIAPDGSRYLVMSDGSAPIGVHNACGAWNATYAPLHGVVPNKAPDGSFYVSNTRRDGALFVTVVSGSLGSRAPDGPVLTSVSLTGTPTVGETLTGSETHTGSATTSYQWLRNGSPIVGATSSTYVLVEADTLQEISVYITVANITGSDSDLTSAVAIAAAAGGAPEWLPDGALAFADFKNGNYYANGAETTLTDMWAENLDWNSFDPVANVIGGTGLVSTGDAGNPTLARTIAGDLITSGFSCVVAFDPSAENGTFQRRFCIETLNLPDYDDEHRALLLDDIFDPQAPEVSVQFDTFNDDGDGIAAFTYSGDLKLGATFESTRMAVTASNHSVVTQPVTSPAALTDIAMQLQAGLVLETITFYAVKSDADLKTLTA
jgi:hypothetical protein